MTPKLITKKGLKKRKFKLGMKKILIIVICIGKHYLKIITQPVGIDIKTHTMKKHIAKNLRELAQHLPPVYEWIPNTETKTGAELNAIIIEQHQKSLSWHAKIINVARQHLADMGLQHLAPKTPELKDVNAQYTLKKKTIRLVNHYHKLKEAWTHGGQAGIGQYAKWAVSANQEQQKQAYEKE